MNSDSKYFQMMVLAAQIEALQELPYNTVYPANSNLGELKQKSAVYMDDLIRILNEKRGELAKLDGSKVIHGLKTQLSRETEKIELIKSLLSKEDLEKVEEKLKELEEKQSKQK